MRDSLKLVIALALTFGVTLLIGAVSGYNVSPEISRYNADVFERALRDNPRLSKEQVDALDYKEIVVDSGPVTLTIVRQNYLIFGLLYLCSLIAIRPNAGLVIVISLLAGLSSHFLAFMDPDSYLFHNLGVTIIATGILFVMARKGLMRQRMRARPKGEGPKGT